MHKTSNRMGPKVLLFYFLIKKVKALLESISRDNLLFLMMVLFSVSILFSFGLFLGGKRVEKKRDLIYFIFGSIESSLLLVGFL